MDKIECDGSLYASPHQDKPYLERYTFTDAVREALKHPTFNNWDYEDNELVALVMHMYMELGVINHFGIELQTLYNFVNAVRHHYNNNVRYISPDIAISLL
jgi:hypothetical protein